MIVTAHDPSLHRNVKTLASGWYADARQPLAQATAARVYGLARAIISREDALAALTKLTIVDDIRVAIAIGDATTDLLNDITDSTADDNFACHVLATLVSCLDDRKKSATIQLVFLILAATLVVTVRTAEAPQGSQWPYLLDLAIREPQARSALIRMLVYVLNGAYFVDEASQVMTQWAAVAEADPRLREPFLRLIRAVAAKDQRSRMILTRYAALWVSDENFRPIPQISGAVKALLDTEGTL
jgi:hypothetical protein